MLWKTTHTVKGFYGVLIIAAVASLMLMSNKGLMSKEFKSVSAFPSSHKPRTKALHSTPLKDLPSTRPTTKSPKIWNLPDDNPSYFVPRKHKLTPIDFPFKIVSDICKQTSPHLLILIVSMASHVEYRKAIRETWASLAYNKTWPGEVITKSVKLVFLFGSNNNKAEDDVLRRESAETRDIVQFDFRESYFNLTYKVLSGLKWARDYCADAKYVMKNDEDSIVHIPWLFERLNNADWNSSIIGPYFVNGRTFWEGKYAIDSNAYPFKVYPPHVKGNVYIMPKTTAMRLLEVSEFMPYVNMEDAHITGILAKTIGAKHAQISRSQYNPYMRPAICDIVARKKFAGRDVSESYVRQIWETVSHREKCTGI